MIHTISMVSLQENGECGGVGESYSDSSNVSCNESALKWQDDHCGDMKDPIQELFISQAVDNAYVPVITGKRYV